MRLSLSTQALQTMTAKAIKGASMNKMLPLTSLIAIELKDNRLTMITTDYTNYLYVKADKVFGDDFYVVVPVEIFSKLVSRLTCEKVTLELDNSSLTVIGNGKYSIELPLDEEGELVKFPNPIAKEDSLADVGEINLTTVRTILNTAKASVAQTDEVPCYEGYYLGDKIVSTDTYVMCGIDIKIFDEPALVSQATMNLLDVFSAERIKMLRDGDTVVFDTPDVTVYGKLMDSISDYQIDVINSLLEQEFDSKCKVSKTTMLQLLDRLSLFVVAYDKNGIYLTFTREGIQVDSKQANSSELIPYSESENFKEYTCCIDINMLKAQIKAYTADSVTLQYGAENSIKLTEGTITQVIALLDDDR